MRKYVFSCVVFVILALQMGPLTDAQADVVGRLTQVEGRVDILKGGQLPATPVKADDGVQPGDVLRTKSLSKAQITFIDNSTMTIAPESRVAIEAYMFDAAQNKRNAVIELFKGLAHVVVSKVYQSAEPDFVVKTQTAIMGIRGTDFGIRLQPNSTDILNFQGRLQVGNIFPEVGQLPQRAFKVAYAFGSGEGSHWVFLDEMQATSVAQGLPPTQAYTISDEDRRHFINQLGTGLNICRRNPEAGDTETGGGPPSETISGCAPTTGLSGSDLPTGNIDLVSAFFGSYFTPPYTPPNSPLGNETSPPNENNVSTSPPTPKIYNFTLTTYGVFFQSACRANGEVFAAAIGNGRGGSPVLLTSCGIAILQGDWGKALPSLYCATDSSTFTRGRYSRNFPSGRVYGIYYAVMTGSVTGVLGSGPLIGTASLQSYYISCSYALANSVKKTVQVTIDPSGRITYSYDGGKFISIVGSSFIFGTSAGSGTAYPWGTKGTHCCFNAWRHHHGLRGAGLGPTIPNFILSNVITNPAMHCFRNFPGKPGILPAGITDHREGHQAVHHRKHKPEGNPGHSPGGQVNGAFQGGPPGNHQGPTTGACGSKPGGGGA
jgi:hypothetical protein